MEISLNFVAAASAFVVILKRILMYSERIVCEYLLLNYSFHAMSINKFYFPSLTLICMNEKTYNDCSRFPSISFTACSIT
jgi:hypothetical protein